MTPCLDVFVCLRIWKEVKWYLSCSAKHVLEIRGLVVTFIWFAYFLFWLLKLGLWCCYSFNSCLRLVFHHVIGSLLPVFHQKKKKKRPLHDTKTKAAITVTYWLLIKFSFLKLVGIWCWGQWGREGKIQAAKSCWMLQPLRAEGRLWACFVQWIVLLLRCLFLLPQGMWVTVVTQIHVPAFHRGPFTAGEHFTACPCFNSFALVSPCLASLSLCCFF